MLERLSFFWFFLTKLTAVVVWLCLFVCFLTFFVLFVCLFDRTNSCCCLFPQFFFRKWDNMAIFPWGFFFLWNCGIWNGERSIVVDICYITIIKIVFWSWHWWCRWNLFLVWFLLCIYLLLTVNSEQWTYIHYHACMHVLIRTLFVSLLILFASSGTILHLFGDI